MSWRTLRYNVTKLRRVLKPINEKFNITSEVRFTERKKGSYYFSNEHTYIPVL